MGVQYLSIAYSESLAENDIVASVGSRGDSYDNALAESFNGLYKWELIHRQGPWRGLDDVEFATMTYVDWFNHHRLHGEITTDASYTTPSRTRKGGSTIRTRQPSMLSTNNHSSHRTRGGSNRQSHHTDQFRSSMSNNRPSENNSCGRVGSHLYKTLGEVLQDRSGIGSERHFHRPHLAPCGGGRDVNEANGGDLRLGEDCLGDLGIVQAVQPGARGRGERSSSPASKPPS